MGLNVKRQSMNSGIYFVSCPTDKKICRNSTWSLTSNDLEMPPPNAQTGFSPSLPDPWSCAPASRFACDDRHTPINWTMLSPPASKFDHHPVLAKLRVITCGLWPCRATTDLPSCRFWLGELYLTPTAWFITSGNGEGGSEQIREGAQILKRPPTCIVERLLVMLRVDSRGKWMLWLWCRSRSEKIWCLAVRISLLMDKLNGQAKVFWFKTLYNKSVLFAPKSYLKVSYLWV